MYDFCSEKLTLKWQDYSRDVNLPWVKTNNLNNTDLCICININKTYGEKLQWIIVENVHWFQRNECNDNVKRKKEILKWAWT
jgi:hypothetical protein